MSKIKYSAFDDIYGKGFCAEIECNGMECNDAIEIAKKHLYMLLADIIDENQDYNLYFTRTNLNDRIILKLSSSYC